MRTVLTVGILMIATPALAYPTEVDPGELRDKRLATVRHYRWLENVREEQRREERQALAALDKPSPGSSPPAPTYPSGVLTAEEVASYARGAGFPENVIPTMVAIAFRESRFNPGAVNSSSGACGLWQMYPCPGPEALNPATNAAMAYYKFTHGGLCQHWRVNC